MRVWQNPLVVAGARQASHQQQYQEGENIAQEKEEQRLEARACLTHLAPEHGPQRVKRHPHQKSAVRLVLHRDIRRIKGEAPALLGGPRNTTVKTASGHIVAGGGGGEAILLLVHRCVN